MSLPFPLKAGEALYDQAGAHVWHDNKKRFQPYRVYLTSHRILGIDRSGEIGFNHFFSRVNGAEVDNSFWRDVGARVELSDGGSVHLSLIEDQKISRSRAIAWVNRIQGHVLNLRG